MMPRRRKTMGKKIIRESLERLNLGVPAGRAV